MSGPIESKSPFCIALVDLLPALRWGDPRQLGPLLEDPRLPGTWWNDTSLTDVTATIGAEEVAHRAAQALRAQWPHLTLGVALPNLCFCPEGQGTDLRVTIEQAASDAGAEEEVEALAGLVRPLLRPFLMGGRNLMKPVPAASRDESAAESDQDVRSLADTLVRLIPADAAPAIRAAVDTLRAWAQEHPEEDSSASVRAVAEQFEATPGGKAESALLEAPLNALESLISDWGERQLSVAAARTFGQNRISLESLGEQFGVSRERVRQIQVELEKKLQLWLHSGAGQPFLGHLLAVQQLLGPVATETELRELHPVHELAVPALGLPLWQLIASLLPDRTWTSGWLVEGDLDERIEQARAELTRRCSESAPVWAEVVELLGELGIREAAAEEWLLAVKGFRVTEGHLLPWGRSVNDRAEAVLMLVGRPLTMENLLARLDDGTALASLRNQIQTDDRFMRCDRDLYGLRRWGGVEYLGIREMIIRELETVGGEAKSEDIIASLCSQFDVSDKSVRAYLAAPEFERFKRGWIRVAASTETGSADYQPRRDVAQTRRCFQTGQGTWWYRLDVNGEHLRGSGFTIPAGFAAHLGLAPGGRLELSHDVGDIQLVWRNQPSCGSIRPLLERMDAVEGNHVFVAAKDGRLKALRLADEPDLNLTDTQRALRLMALSGQVTEKDMPAVLGRRIGLADARTMDEVLAHLRIRGDKDILELLSEQYEPELCGTAALDEGLSVPAIPAGDLSSASTPQHSAPDPQPTGNTENAAKQAAKAEFRDPAWDEEIIPLLDEGSEADLLRLAQELANQGKKAPVFGFELGESGWQADFAWDQDTAKAAVVPTAQHGHTEPEVERRDLAYRAAGWTIRSAVDWLTHLDELLVLLPDATPGS
ncbi:hypothetical protein [Streptomyces sp. NRRL F-5702]|uniref:hypothetical protein n=1 Tax=Streptomyces sp. NRRL F-5702 TaxID=1463870 RepID=UPI00067D7F9E|nr:hypothetical protein [Streptomyces sp. NRRL F-5702]